MNKDNCVHVDNNLEHRSSSTTGRIHHDSDKYRSSTESNGERCSSSATTRRVHLINENKNDE